MKDRFDARIVEAIVANPDVSILNVRGAPIIATWDSFVPAVFSAVVGFFAGVTAGALLEKGQPTAFAIAFVASWVSYNGFYFLDRYISAGRYKAAFWDGEEVEEQQDSIIVTARRNEMKRLTGRLRTLLQTFARHYEEIGTAAIIPWYESHYLNRTQIEDVREYIVLIGAAVKDQRGIVSLTEWGEAQLAKWTAGDFGDVMRLAPASPTPGGG